MKGVGEQGNEEKKLGYKDELGVRLRRES